MAALRKIVPACEAQATRHSVKARQGQWWDAFMTMEVGGIGRNYRGAGEHTASTFLLHRQWHLELGTTIFVMAIMQQMDLLQRQ